MSTTNENSRLTLYDYCVKTNHMDLLQEWDQVRNKEVHPWDVTFSSHKKIWWECKDGHSWEAAVKSRIRGSGCPVCACRTIVPGVNDLGTTYPAIAEQWHPTKNGELTPEQVAAGTTKKVWWRCEKGHEWFAPVMIRTRGSGCPVCCGKQVVKGFNDLASIYPELAAQWIPEKNLPLKPDGVTPYSNHRVWWRCEKGHEWQALISARSSSSSGCPYCTGKKALAGFNDLATVYPKIAAQWDYAMNGELTPEMVTAGSKKRVWWKCAEGHEWRAIVYSRTGKRKHGCPVCAGGTQKTTLNVYLALPETVRSGMRREASDAIR